ncbi:MAG: carboxypeptidase regulatory-like domain-containing protein, partial [Blastocatellia bacterium]|nr:carboxypeptidase regulatory-like domain-containing protein [Blastocatellia bacterium]
MRKYFRLFKLTILLVTITVVVNAQTATATLKGQVSDSGGSAVAGASVTLTSIATGLKKSFTTDAHGQFIFTFLEPGFYTLEAQAGGFKIHRHPRLQLEVGQTVELNLALTPGELQETVNITAAEAPGLDTTTSSLGSIVGRQRVDVLPLNGRNVFQLAQLEIGVTTAPGSRDAN